MSATCAHMSPLSLRGLEPASADLLSLVSQLAANEVPKQWLATGPEINAESIGAWVGDLQDRLDFLYSWAVEGPPLVIPLGLMARPKSYLTAMLQIHAERLDVSVGKLTFECKILCEGHEDLPPPEQLTPDEAATLWLHLSPDPLQVLLHQHTVADSVLNRKSSSGLDGLFGAKAKPELRVSQDGINAIVLGEAFSLAEVLKEGCLISGAVLQGAKWNSSRGELQEADSKAIFSSVPMLWLKPVVASKGDKEANSNPILSQQDSSAASMNQRAGAAAKTRYICPVYCHSYSFGTRFSSLATQSDVDDCLFTVGMAVGPHLPDHWVQRNVNLLLCADTQVLLSLLQN
jgi:dynein heavy chain